MTNSGERPSSFSMPIQGGMLEALGINMYTSLGKCLVEFAANAYDSNSHHVEITIPFDEIDKQRQEIKKAIAAEREKAKQQAEKEGKPLPDEPDLTAFSRTIDETIAITVKDDGHGMSPSDVADKFLPVNRRRRLDACGKETSLQSEGNRRHVMGRKGLGKLAGFGTAQKIEVATKRAGQDFRTIFEMDAGKLMGAPDIAQMPIPAKYEENLPGTLQGTTVTLRSLKPDAVKSTRERIEHSLAQAFYGIDPQDFEIKLNGNVVKAPVAEYEYEYPEGLKAGTMATELLEIPDIGKIPLNYVVRFRKRGDHLTAGLRGARIYCNHRLAAGPSLFKLGTGMHNFHGQDYMECVVVADELDRLGIDFVNTNRTQLREDNDVVDQILTRVTEIMRLALAKHAQFREEKAEKEIAESEVGKFTNQIIENLPAKTRGAAGKMLKSFAVRFGAGSEEFRELAPLVVQSMNAGDVLVRLIELQSDPKTIAHVASELKDLAEIEKSDALKIFRGRLNGITALQRLVDKGDDLWKKKQFENELHDLLKQLPWLIRPEYERYVSSDEDLGKLSTRIAKTLGVDKFSVMTDPKTGKADLARPDLVFVMCDMTAPEHFSIVELKSPGLPLDITHYQQLETYIFKIEKYIKHELKQTPHVTGYLIGAKPKIDGKLSTDEEQLLDKIAKDGTNPQIEVIGLVELLQRTKDVHQFILLSIQAELEEAGSPFAPVLPPAGPAKSLGAPAAASTALAK